MKDSPTGHIIEGALRADGLRLAIVAGRWNDLIVSRLIGGAQDALLRLGARENDLTLVRVPGSFEIPLAAKKLAASGRYDAIICVGTVSRGDPDNNASPRMNPRASGWYTLLPVAYGITERLKTVDASTVQV